MTDREIFRSNLKELMRLAKVKQTDVAKFVGLTEKTVSAWITGRGYPRPEAMGKLCQFFGVKISDLTEPKNPKETNEDRIIKAFRSLSTEGQEKLIERAIEMTIIYPKGKKHHG